MNDRSQNIVFDWNSTLLDDIHALHECVNIVFERFGRAAVGLDAFRDHYEVPFEKLYANHGFGPDEIARIIALSKDVFHDHYEPRAVSAPLRPGARDILARTQKAGVQNVILSNHITGPIRTQLRRLAIEHHFAEVLAYADRASQGQGMTKGDKLRAFMKARQASPQRTMIVGDSIEEIQIARDQGLISVALTGGCASEKRLKAEEPDHLIHSLHDLQPILEERGFVS